MHVLSRVYRHGVLAGQVQVTLVSAGLGDRACSPMDLRAGDRQLMPPFLHDVLGRNGLLVVEGAAAAEVTVESGSSISAVGAGAAGVAVEATGGSCVTVAVESSSI